jgi:FkbM family methyltransferase
VTADVIYDFGMNNGDDVDYYLRKGMRVVGVEANPELCNLVEKRFAADIKAGRLVVLNVALSEAESAAPITFYVHKTNHVLSQLPKPSADLVQHFTAIDVPCRTPASIVHEYGEPAYVKIDVESYDSQVLQNLFANGIFPPEISAESHSIRVFACLVTNGYTSFALVDGSTVSREYGEATIATPDGPVKFAFKHHSAGPFGEDIRARWEDADTFFHTLAIAGLGWKDIHASRVIPPSPPLSGARIAARQAKALIWKAGRAVRTRTIGRVRRG